MTNIIRDRALVATASTADLISTYNALTGSDLQRFSSRTVAERRTEMAIMSAENASGHRGVPKGTTPVAQTVAELEQASPETPEADPNVNPFTPGTMAHQLWVATKAWKENSEPRKQRPAKAPSRPRESRQMTLIVKATRSGISKVQVDSVRGQVLAYIQEAPDGICTIAELNAHFKVPVLGYVHKLVQKNHLEVIA